MCMIGIIYCAYNKVNKKRYIGQTIKDLAIRIRGHYSNYSNCLYFHRALIKYKKEDWEWKVIVNANPIDYGIYFNFDLEQKELEISNAPRDGYDDTLYLDEIIDKINGNKDSEEDED